MHGVWVTYYYDETAMASRIFTSQDAANASVVQDGHGQVAWWEYGMDFRDAINEWEARTPRAKIRKVVGREGQDFGDGRFLEKGALYVEDDVIPVTIGSGYHAVAKASEFARDEETGEVSFLFEVLDEHAQKDPQFDLAQWHADVFIAPFEATTNEDSRLMNITKGRVRSVSLQRIWQPELRV